MDNNTPTVYVVRPSDRVADQIEAEHKRQEKLVSPAVADAWEDGLTNAITSLATLPMRRVAALEDKLFQQTHPGDTLYVHLYQRTRTGPTWRILFTVHEADQNDPPTVRIQMLRHGAQALLTRWPDDDE